MPELALPCIACGTALRNVDPHEIENQPEEGVAFSSPGHYGSTVFDPMDGTFLEINVCDPCLVKAGEQGRVLSGRRRRPVTVERLRVGWEDVDKPLVPWTEGLPGYGDSLDLDPDEDIEKLPKTVHIDPDTWGRALRLIQYEED